MGRWKRSSDSREDLTASECAIIIQKERKKESKRETETAGHEVLEMRPWTLDLELRTGQARPAHGFDKGLVCESQRVPSLHNSFNGESDNQS